MIIFVLPPNSLKKLHKLGFIPIYREIGVDKIYYLKTDEICKILGKEETP